MKLHLITVVFQDGEDLAATYRSCPLEGEFSLDVSHWIFAKKHHDGLAIKYPLSQVVPSNDSGIYNAMNLAFEHIQPVLNEADVVLFLNAGDRLNREGLSIHLQRHVQEHADVSVAAVDLLRNGVPIGRRPPPAPSATCGETIYQQFPCHQSTFYSGRFLKNIWRQRGVLYREDFRVCSDLELYLLAQHHKIIATNSATSAYDVEGYSSKQALLVADEKERLLKIYGASFRWKLYSIYWKFKAHMVAPKQRLARLIRQIT